MTDAALTIFTSTAPATLGKTYTLQADGKLSKTTAGQMVAGSFTVKPFNTAHDLATILSCLTTAQAISSSLPTSGKPSGRVATEKALASGNHSDAVARTKRHFNLPAGQPGFALIDVDAPPSSEPLSRDALWQLLTDLCPAIASAGVLWWPSGSSCIFDGDTQLQGIRGQHCLLLVQDLSDLVRFGQVLNQRLWLAGHGRIEVSSSGALLERSIVDASVHQPARLVFSAGAVCHPPLSQRRGAPLVLADGPALDTRAALPDLTGEEQGRYAALVEAAKAQASPRAAEVRSAWMAAHGKAAARAAVDAGEDPHRAAEAVTRTMTAALGGTLLGDFALILVDEAGSETTITVDQALKDPTRYNLSRCLDPLNPDHRDRTPDSILYLNQAQPIVYSLDDGGRVYQLRRQPVRLPIVNGERSRLAEQIVSELSSQPDLFMYGGTPHRIAPGITTPLTRPALAYVVGCRVALYRQGKDKAAPAEADAALLDMVAALLPDALPRVVARSTIPLITTKGRIINQSGFDSETGIYLDIQPGSVEPIPDAPTPAEVAQALRRLWQPWSAYKWADSHSRAAMLATILTVPLRPTIDAAPGLFADAPSQASGKSKAVGAVAALVHGDRRGVKTWVGDDEAEMEKYLLSLARSGDGAAILDNVSGVMRSPALAVAMAEGRTSGRLLGVNQTINAYARITWLASGNNASLDRDMSTRWLLARIDTKTENPSQLAFPFDPVTTALSDRMGIVRSALIMHRAWHAAGCPRPNSVNSRFAEWGAVVRHLVLWLASSGQAENCQIGSLGDPCHTILGASAAHDPEHEATAMTWHALTELFNGQPFTAADVRKVYDFAADGLADDAALNLREGMEALVGTRTKPGTRVFHTVLNNRRDRIAGGLRLELLPAHGATRGACWRITSAQPEG